VEAGIVLRFKCGNKKNPFSILKMDLKKEDDTTMLSCINPDIAGNKMITWDLPAPHLEPGLNLNLLLSLVWVKNKQPLMALFLKEPPVDVYCC
jgi:hypothetical protein